MQENNKGVIAILVGGLILITVIVYLFWILIFSIRIEAGEVGIKVNMYGNKGVQVEPLHTGRNYYNPITSDVYRYSTFIQQKEYRDIKFQDTDGLVITANIGMDYKFNEALVPKIFEEYRASSSKITNEYVPTWLKNSINRAASEFKVDELYGPKKEDFRLKVLEYIKADFDSKGVVVNNIYFVGDMELPPQVMDRINAKIAATQEAMQKENELRTVKAEAEKQIAQAEGAAKSAVISAQGEADAKLIQAKADAEKIKIQAQAIQVQGGSDYIKLQWIQSWNGILPSTMMGDSSNVMYNLK